MLSSKDYAYCGEGDAMLREIINEKINHPTVKYDVVNSYGKLMELVGVEGR